jgi:hypothetical protein
MSKKRFFILFYKINMDFIKDLITNIYNDDSIFDNFIEEINSINFNQYQESNTYDQEQTNMNHNIIENLYFIRQSISFNIQRRQRETRERHERHERRERLELEQMRLNNTISDTISNLFTIFMEDHFNEDIGEDVKITLSEAEFNNLSTILGPVDEEKLKECNICLEQITPNDKLVVLKCDHIYHKHCIKEWLCNQSTKCCVCRFDQR